ncbi:hypothetical protein RF11_11393 [Thelohanellus kitauei]|uniref:Tc1-like transposase DDE domain-containing protein n=1 Tax=Thelohanellus kitauei TaxID=669202 RepID=A0A0C2NEE4_THEKT|nr:hypothetical protein RF11_11393 [Thelohanellus kitauei]
MENNENTNSERRTYKKLSDDVKMLAIGYIQRNPEKSIAEVARNLSLYERSLRYTYSKFLRDGNVIQNNQAGPKYVKVEDQHKLRIGEYIEENPIITIAQILSKLQEDFNLVLSKSTICRTIKKLNITYKLVRQVPIARNTPEIIEARFIYSQTYFESIAFSTPEVVYIDETGFNLHIRRRYGRSQRGERAHIVVSNSRGRNISVCAAMNISGLVNYRSIVASFNKNEFCQFLRECFQKLSNTPKIFVMDNVRFHHSIEVREVVESQGHRIVFIPPYSPQLNPIELLFSKWKNIIKSGMSIFDGNTMLTTISAVSTQISGDDCAGWIREATRFASRALQHEPF